MIKYLEGLIINSHQAKRTQIAFDQSSGLIVEVGDTLVNQNKVDYYYGDDDLVFPGFIDIHVHAREDVTGADNYKEDFTSAGLAAVNGGVTAFMDMPNNKFPPIEEKGYYAKIPLATKSAVPVFLYAGIGRQTRPLNFPAPYKVYMTKSVGDLFINDNEWDEVLSRYAGCMVSFHCEDGQIVKKNMDQPTHLTRRPPEAEIMAIEKAIELSKKYNIEANICHVSTKEGLKKIIEAKKQNFKITCEVTPQHLYFCNEKLSSFEKNFLQMNPTIRSREDQEGVLEYFLNGAVDFLATDHAPHTLMEKLSGVSGLTGLDTYGMFVTWLIKNCHMDVLKLVKTTSENPGTYVGKFLKNLQKLSSPYKKLGDGIGFIQKGYAASFTVLSTAHKIKMTKSEIKSKTNWSPFEDKTFPGNVKNTFVLGKLLK